MTAPGSTVTRRTSAPPRSAPTDTSVFFLVGFAEKGPTTPQPIQNMDDYAAGPGARVSYGYAYDALDAFFKEGGSKAYFVRALGPTPVKATHNFLDAVPAISLTIKAKTYGDWGNGLSIAITHPDGTHFVLAVSLNSVLVETSPSFTTQQQAVDWSAGSSYVDVTLGVGTAIPAVATAALTTGTDDHGNATETEWLAALSLFTKDLGPGQVAMPGHTTATGHANLLAHAIANNRTPLLDYADTASKATIVTAAGTDRDVDGAGRCGAFGPWVVIPGVVAGVPRTVPPSGPIAGLLARNDQRGVSTNQPSAGPIFGVLSYAIGLSQVPWSESDRSDLNDAGVNAIRTVDGAIQVYGNRTLADPDTDPQELLFSNARILMEITAKSQAIADGYAFRMVDGFGHAFSDLQSDLNAEIDPYYKAGALYGLTPQDAYTVDVGPQVNTEETIAALKIRAAISVQLSPAGERVEIDIVSTAVTQGVS